ncbi:DNA replication and repair protein recF [Thermodesulfobium narugense DSM 14796]|uniref:DNA replication and repair protein RecF n=1 Tax=Thermodesulfobium narugense DSM 14796 TaxID=747365 RepID=M1E4L3_9BACT|nr:AAA family ATPase [Thermodesulfobium narugense]AEE13656.1 DNA replication and repair protein recF [Thermodesulfobium narugense DSM 14796]
MILEIHHFRNFEHNTFNLSKKNLIIGENASGKTNLLEAIYLTLRGKTKNNIPNQNLIQFSRESALIRNTVYGKRIEIMMNNKNKILKINDKKLNSSIKLWQYFKVFYINLFDSLLLSQEPKNKRKFLDEIIININPEKIKLYKDLKILNTQKNYVLKNKTDKELIKSYDIKLTQLSQEISNLREEVLNNVILNTKKLLKEESIQIKFYKSLESKEIKNKEIIEAKTKRNIINPSRDNFSVKIRNIDSSFLSTGEIKKFSLALHLAKISIFKEHNCVSLFDEINSFLDKANLDILLKWLQKIDGYVIVTSTSELDLENFDKIFL